MSNFLKKGKREHEKDLEKQTAKTMDMFNKTLMAMNHVFTILEKDTELTEANFEEKVKAITDWKFSERQLSILKRDILAYEPEESDIE